jgi:methionyl-tRNA formyltransferase
VSPTRLRIVFFGTPDFALPTLERLVASPHDVIGVVTQPDRPRGRGQHVRASPVKVVARQAGLPVLQPDRLAREAFEAPFGALHADVGVVAAYGRILPEWLLQALPRGVLNVHASLLPRYRGAAPVHRAILSGERETGVTIMRVVKALDAGPMLAQSVRPLGPDEPSDLVERDLAVMGADLLVGLLDDFAAGRIEEVAQRDADATYAPRLTKEEGRLDFSRPAVDVHNRVRGLRPWPMAYTLLAGRRLVIHRSRVSDGDAGAAVPGAAIARSGTTLTIACGDGRAVDVLEIQPDGRRVMTPREFLAGHPVRRGQLFG